ncbi:hypothetical protein ACFL3S_09135 [Gemmatimonadota bacterium]
MWPPSASSWHAGTGRPNTIAPLVDEMTPATSDQLEQIHWTFCQVLADLTRGDGDGEGEIPI